MNFKKKIIHLKFSLKIYIIADNFFMKITVLKSKIHRATVTDTQLEYDGSCAIDSNYLKEANISPFEQIHIYNLTNGERLITYAIEAEAGSKIISMMGAAAHKASKGDSIIIVAYGSIEETEAKSFEPKIVRL